MNRPPEPGLIDAMGRVGGTVVELLQSRLELAGLELGEARERLVVLLAAGLGAALLLCGAVAALTAWVAVAAWPVTGPSVLGWVAAVYAASGIGLLLWLRSRWRSDPPLLVATLAELRADVAALRGDDPR